MNTKYKFYGLTAVVVVLIAASILIFFSFSKKNGNVDILSVNYSQSDIDDEDNEVRMIFVGDMMLSRNIGKLMSQNNDWTYPFKNISGFLRNADLTVGNLEGPISERGIKVGSIYSFRADPKVVIGLSDSGFDVLSIANNHMWDYGEEAFYDTLKILKENGIDYIGGGEDFDEAHTAVIKEVKGTKIAFLGYTDLLPAFLLKKESKPAVAFPDTVKMIEDINNAKKRGDIVIVSLHWGEEYSTKHNENQKITARALVDAGADIVIGHHPHVVQELEKYKDGYIAYSLGNFVFDQNFSADTGVGLILEIIIKNKKISNIKQYKIGFNSTFQPFIMNEQF